MTAATIQQIGASQAEPRIPLHAYGSSSIGGTVVGKCVGIVVGELVGTFFGDCVGTVVGELVGIFVGDCVVVSLHHSWQTRHSLSQISIIKMHV